MEEALAYECCLEGKDHSDDVLSRPLNAFHMHSYNLRSGYIRSNQALQRENQQLTSFRRRVGYPFWILSLRCSSPTPVGIIDSRPQRIVIERTKSHDCVEKLDLESSVLNRVGADR